MKFFQTLKLSLTNLQAYETFLHSPLKSTAWFTLRFYAFVFAAALLCAVPLAKYVQDYTLEHYPEDLVLTFEHVTLKTNGAEFPLTVAAPELPVLGSVGATLREKEATVIVNNETVPVPYGDVFPEDLRFVVTQSAIRENGWAAAAAILFSFVLVIAMGIAISRALSIALYSGFLTIISLLLGKKIAYKILLQIALHVAVAAEVVNIAYLLLYRGTAFPMFDTAFTGIYLLVLWSMRKTLLR